MKKLNLKVQSAKCKAQGAKFQTPLHVGLNLFFNIFVLILFSVPSFSAPSLLQLGKAAPPFTLKTDDGKKITPGNFKNRSVVILSFWIPEHTQSMEEIEKLQKILGSKKIRGVEVLTITRGNGKKEKEAARSAFDKRKIKFPILCDEDVSVSKDYDVFTFPAFYIIDRSGNLATALITNTTNKIRNFTFTEILEKITSGKTVDVLEFHPKINEPTLRQMLGKQLPDFKLKDLAGNTQSPIYYRGFKKLIIVFWQPWCPHCQKELPRLQRFYEKYSEILNVEILAVCGANDKKSQEQMNEFIKKEKITFPVLNDEEKGSYQKYHAE
ncbi:MAG: TlpA disulfide reductase family protein, partial [bacterium]